MSKDIIPLDVMIAQAREEVRMLRDAARSKSDLSPHGDGSFEYLRTTYRADVIERQIDTIKQAIDEERYEDAIVLRDLFYIKHERL